MKIHLTLKSLLLFFLFPVSIPLLAQTVVSGTISDKATQKPLVGVNIVVSETVLGTTSGANRKYPLTINQSPPFAYRGLSMRVKRV
jgi:iron complex outermembrane receptor protein